MSEINLNGVSGSAGISRSLNAAGGQKTNSVPNPAAGADSAEFSHLSDIESVDNAVEKEFETLRSRLQESANSELYPPLETIDKLAAMLAIEVSPDQGKAQ